MDRQSTGKPLRIAAPLGGLLGGLLLSGFGNVASADAPPRTVSVSGTCIRNVVPDRAAILLPAEAKDADARRAQIAATKQYEAIRSKIVALKLPDAELMTAEYTSEEIREWEKDRQVSKGFRTRITLRVETSDPARLGEVVEIAARESIKQASGLQLFVSSKRMLAERTACLKEAAEQARVKGDSLAKSLGAKLGEVMTIQESSGPGYEAPPSPMFRGAMAMDVAAQKAAPAIEPGKTEIVASVQVSFGLR